MREAAPFVWIIHELPAAARREFDGIGSCPLDGINDNVFLQYIVVTECRITILEYMNVAQRHHIKKRFSERLEVSPIAK